MTRTLGDVLISIEPGVSPRALDRPAMPGELGVLKVSAVTWGSFRAEENKALPSGYEPDRTPRVRRGDLLISRANTRSLVGAIVMVEADYPSLLLSDKVLRLTVDRGRADPRFVVHAMRRPEVRNHFESRSGGTSGSMQNISQDVIRSAPFPAIDVLEQKRIADILDQADALRAKRRAALAQLDTLTQAIFLEMFGEPTTNPKGLTKKTLAELVKLKSGDFLPASAMVATGPYAVYGGNGISGYHDHFLFDEPRIAIGRVGAYCGCVHVTQPKSWITDNALYISTYSEELNFNYLAVALAQLKLNQFSSQFGQPLISGSRIYPVTMLVPTKNAQAEFSKRSAAATELKASYGASLTELDALFASLQHRAFRGEL